MLTRSQEGRTARTHSSHNTENTTNGGVCVVDTAIGVRGTEHLTPPSPLEASVADAVNNKGRVDNSETGSDKHLHLQQNNNNYTIKINSSQDRQNKTGHKDGAGASN